MLKYLLKHLPVQCIPNKIAPSRAIGSFIRSFNTPAHTTDVAISSFFAEKAVRTQLTLSHRGSPLLGPPGPFLDLPPGEVRQKKVLLVGPTNILA